METFLLISAIIVTLTALLAIHRLNLHMAKYHALGTQVYPHGQPLYYLNTAGKWLTLAGGFATLPLVLALIFIPFGAASWIITTGVNGFILLILAALSLTFVLITHGIKQKKVIKGIVKNISQHYIGQVTKLNFVKVISWLTALGLLIAFLPFFIELFNTLVLLGGFILAVRFGLFDDISDKDTDDDISFGYLNKNDYYMAYDNDYHYDKNN